MVIVLEKKQIKARKEAQRIAINIKKLFIFYNREVGDIVKAAKKVKKASNTAAKITCQKNTKKN